MSRTAIITGASSGIGAATAKALHNAGFNLVLGARRINKLEKLKSDLGDNVEIIATDVCVESDVSAMVDLALTKFGKVDVLINNAGLGYLAPFVDGKLDEWHRMMDVNVKGLLTCIHVALPHLLKSEGHIVNIASVAAHEVFPNATVYCASKHAVNAITIGIRKELRDKVRVTNISPGTVVTEFFEHTTHEEVAANMKESMTEEKRKSLLQSTDIATAILDVLSKPNNVAINEVIIRPNV